MAKKRSKTFKGHTAEFETDDAGKVWVTLDNGKKEAAKEAHVDVSPHNEPLFDNTIIATSHNPICYWYYSGGKWYWICV